MKLAISFLSEKKENISKLNETSADYIHYDVIDNVYVKGKSLSFDEMKDLRITKPKDIHLMVKDVEKYVFLFQKLKPEFITFHVSATANVKEMIDYIHSFGIKAGLALNPNEDISLLTPYLNDIDLVLLMSVFPGKGGQTFIDVSDKIVALKNADCLIEVDGGINDETIKKLSGADIVVVGSFITNGNYEERIKSLWKKKDLL